MPYLQYIVFVGSNNADHLVILLCRLRFSDNLTTKERKAREESQCQIFLLLSNETIGYILFYIATQPPTLWLEPESLNCRFFPFLYSVDIVTFSAEGGGHYWVERNSDRWWLHLGASHNVYCIPETDVTVCVNYTHITKDNKCSHWLSRNLPPATHWSTREMHFSLIFFNINLFSSLPDHQQLRKQQSQVAIELEHPMWN